MCAEAGVAVSTVSVVLNDTPGARVADPTRARVVEAARRLGHTANQHARMLRARGRSRPLLLVVDDHVACGPYAGQILAGLRDGAEAAGADVVVVPTDAQPGRVDAVLATAGRLAAAGVVLAGVTPKRCTAPDSVSVLANLTPSDPEVTHVLADTRTGGRLAAEHLRAHGHTRVGHLALEGGAESDARLAGALAALPEAGHRADPVVRAESVDATAAGGRELAERLLRLPDPPTAIICFNDRMAMGAYQAAAALGLRVPDEVSVVGFENQEPIAESVLPGLTTVVVPFAEVGEEAARLALAPDGSRRGRVEVTCELLERGSVARPAPATRRGRREAAV